jgi:PAS domain S-box-containing protein
VEIHAFPISDESSRVVMVAEHVRDVTERHLAEKALKESEARFKLLFEYAPDAYFLVDMEGNFLDCNRGAEELCGYGREELIGENYQALPLLDDRQNYLVAQLLQQAVHGEILGPVELNLNRRGGGTVIIEAKGLPLQSQDKSLLLVIARDITARKTAEEALRGSEERFRAIFDYTPVGIAMSDIQGRLLQTNRAYQELVGYTNEELRGMTFQDLTHPEDLPDNLRQVEDLLSGKRQDISLEKRYLRKDGAVRWIRIMGTSLHNARGEPQYLLSTTMDITARKQAEESLRESEQRFRDITENAAEWVWEVDDQGQFTYSSPVVEQLLGYTPEEVPGKYFYDFFLPDQREELKDAAMKIFAAKQTVREFLSPNLHKNGQIVWLSTSGIPLLDESGNFLGYRGANIDVTARKQAEKDLQESERKFRLMAETIQDVFWMATPGLDRVIYASPAYEQVWGRSCQEVYQSPQFFLDAIHPEDRERVRSGIVAARAQGIPTDHEYRIIKPDGAVRWIHDRGYPVRDDQDRVIMFTGMATDVTEAKALEGQLLQAQKMEAVGRLAGGVAHDFNNLLMAITGYGELMRAKVLKDDPLYGYLENILEAGDRAAALTQQLLTFSRQKIVHPQAVDLNRVVLDLEPMLRRLIGEDLDLEVVTDPRLGAVKADPGQLGQIIMNLVVNARDAMPQGGRLTLKTAPVDFTVGCHSRFGLTPPGAYVMLEVQDIGVGMDEATQTHVFEPFFTTKAPGKGTGLGLSTVYGIVKQSGGYLDLESKPGAGSTFTVYLPRLDQVVEPPKVKIPITASFRGEETVLLVEDEEVLRGLLAKFLRLYGYTVLEASHGGEALLTCERHQGPIHLMVTDVVMPQMSGRELADRLTPLRPDMKVLYMSGYTEDALVQHGVADLSAVFLQKPFKPLELARQAHAVLHPPASR